MNPPAGRWGAAGRKLAPWRHRGATKEVMPCPLRPRPRRPRPQPTYIVATYLAGATGAR
jgi:hypothetical protein